MSYNSQRYAPVPNKTPRIRQRKAEFNQPFEISLRDSSGTDEMLKPAPPPVAPGVLRTSVIWHQRKISPPSDALPPEPPHPETYVVVRCIGEQHLHRGELRVKIPLGATVRDLKAKLVAMVGTAAQEQQLCRLSPQQPALDEDVLATSLSEDGGPVAEFSLWTPPVDFSLLLRRSKHLKRFVTYDAWKEEDERAINLRNKASKAASEEAAARETASKEASAAAYAAWKKHRTKFFSARETVEVRESVTVDLLCPATQKPFRRRRIGCNEVLTIVHRGCNTHRAATKGTWYTLLTKDGWNVELPAQGIVPPRRPALTADEQYLADADDRRRDAASILADTQKWAGREWRHLQKPKAPPSKGSGGDRPALRSKGSSAAEAIGGEAPRESVEEKRATFEVWLLRKKRDNAVQKEISRLNRELQASDSEQAKARKWKKKAIVSSYSTLAKR